MRNQWFSWRILAFMLLLSLSLAACIQPVAAPSVQALKPGDKIGEMVIAKGPAPFDLAIPPYVAFCNANPEIESNSTVAKPGVYTVECAVPPLPKMMIGFSWVTNNEKLLNDQWPVISTELYVNGQVVDQAAFGSLDADVPLTAAPGADASKVQSVKLRTWNVMLENLTPGQVQLRYVWNIDRELADEMTTVPKGIYDITYKITIDKSLAAGQGTPAPIELVQKPDEMQATAQNGLGKLVGSWQVETTVVKQNATFPSLLTFTSDGIVIADETPSPFETSGHGNWVATGPQAASFTFVALLGSKEGPLSATIKIVGALQYDPKADTWNGPFKVQVIDPSGKAILADTGTFKATRIEIEKLD